jgi:hypothetical protein
MTTSGLSQARLAHLHDILSRHVEDGNPAGLVSVVSRRGDAHVEVIGSTAVDGGAPMQRDAIFPSHR